MASLNYFVCTLGQAARLPRARTFENIGNFLQQQEHHVPDLPAVGFFSPQPRLGQAWTRHILTFEQVYRSVLVVAERVQHELSPAQGQTVALLCPSTAEFLFFWLALMHLGHPVLLLAPQCSPNAVAHLCSICNVSLLFHDETYADLASATQEEYRGQRKDVEHQIRLCCLQNLMRVDIFDLINCGLRDDKLECTSSENDVAYLHHTSGTSAGLPKPIPQTHRAGVGVLPQFDEESKSTFTTTPLYHGGVADLFRAWTSNAMIWLFPGKDVPITSSNIVKCLSAADHELNKPKTPKIAYFSSVPYVLQILAADNDGLEYLRAMEIVGVGGAALPSDFGDKLVDKGINLISRFGSAECGFLLSSHRQYKTDCEWQFLRVDSDEQNLSFEKQADHLSELVVSKNWPHVAKTNRDDGSYATSDLFEPHDKIDGAWRYHSRADSQLTLITGKKFDPAPLEAEIATSPLLRDVLIFGNGRPYPGVLLFRSEKGVELNNQDLIDALLPVFDKIQLRSQKHTRIPENMICPMPFSEENLEKSSKGTIMRRSAEERYATEIEEAYSRISGHQQDHVPDEEVASAITRIVQAVVGKKDGLHNDTDLFAYGVDSIASMQIRHALVTLLPDKSQDLPLTVVEDKSSIENLAKMVTAIRHDVEEVDDKSQYQKMTELVEKYSRFESKTVNLENTISRGLDGSAGEVVLLTGATGFLGAHILDQYIRSPICSKVYCLVRGSSDQAALERVAKSLSARKLSPLPTLSEDSKVVVLRAKLSEPLLGLPPSTYHHLASTVTVIQHSAWAVNFRLSLTSFTDTHIGGLRNLINFALASPESHACPLFVFCSSVASVSNFSSIEGQPVPECVSHDPNDAGQLGYSQSKWVAEAICEAAHRNPRLHDRIAVMRVGQLSADLKTGIWNMSEAYPMILASSVITGSLPDLKDESLAWLPVDLAAKAFVEVAQSMGAAHGSGDLTAGYQNATSVRLYHILNADRNVQWQDLLWWLTESGVKTEIVKVEEWMDLLERLDGKGVAHESLKLLPHWRKLYAKDQRPKSRSVEGGRRARTREFKLKETLKTIPIMSSVGAVEPGYVLRIWNWVQEQNKRWP